MKKLTLFLFLILNLNRVYAGIGISQAHVDINTKNGDNLGTHIATQSLDMGNFAIYNASGVTTGVLSASSATIGGPVFLSTNTGDFLGIGTSSATEKIFAKLGQFGRACFQNHESRTICIDPGNQYITTAIGVDPLKLRASVDNSLIQIGDAGGTQWTFYNKSALNDSWRALSGAGFPLMFGGSYAAVEGSATVVSFMNSGNFGVGIASPVYKMDILGGLHTLSSVTVDTNLLVTSTATFISSMTLSGNRRVQNIAPSNNQVLAWNSGPAEWEPSSLSSLSSGDNLGNHIATQSLNMGNFAIYNSSSVEASNSTTTAVAVFGGTMTLSGNRIVENIAPSGGQVLKWSSSVNRWQPGADNDSFPGQGDNLGTGIATTTLVVPLASLLTSATIANNVYLATTTGDSFRVMVGTGYPQAKLDLNGGFIVRSSITALSDQFWGTGRNISSYTNSNLFLAGNISASTASFTSTMSLSGNRLVANISPSDTQVLKWSSSNNDWEPAADATGSGGSGDNYGTGIATTVLVMPLAVTITSATISDGVALATTSGDGYRVMVGTGVAQNKLDVNGGEIVRSTLTVLGETLLKSSTTVYGVFHVSSYSVVFVPGAMGIVTGGAGVVGVAVTYDNSLSANAAFSGAVASTVTFLIRDFNQISGSNVKITSVTMYFTGLNTTHRIAHNRWYRVNKVSDTQTNITNDQVSITGGSQKTIAGFPITMNPETDIFCLELAIDSTNATPTTVTFRGIYVQFTIE